MELRGTDKTNFRIVILAAVFFIFSPLSAAACPCPDQPDPDKMFAESEAVIRGTVVIVETFGLERFALLRVESSWKGIREDRVIVKTDLGSCGVDFVVGRSYYLWLDQEDERYVTAPCRQNGRKQLDYLKNRPTLELSSANAEPDLARKRSEKKPMRRENRSPPENGKTHRRTDFTLVFTLAVVSSVFLILGGIVAFLFWKHRNR